MNSVPGVDRMQCGSVEVICLTDGDATFGAEVFPSVAAEARERCLAAAGLEVIAADFNAYLLRHADGIDLVDTGCGALYGAQAGRLFSLLAQLGIAPGDVSRLIFTHLHGDHVGGALQDGALVFPQAEVLLHRAEEAHWRGSDKLAGQFLSMVETPVLLEDGADLGHGMTLWHLPGHTPGHSGLRLDGAVLLGDILHSEALQLPDPDASPTYDTDPAMAAETRRVALAEVARDGLIWSGSHMRGPSKFARLHAVDAGYARVSL